MMEVRCVGGLAHNRFIDCGVASVIDIPACGVYFLRHLRTSLGAWFYEYWHQSIAKEISNGDMVDA